MLIFKHTAVLQNYLDAQRQAGKTIGFFPTMGALHEGHISLLRASQGDNYLSVCSIFVNPSQFNEATDLEKYPRPIAQDISKLMQARCDVLFLPAVEEVYPPELNTTVTIPLNGLDSRMEGAFRPGHFAGVMQVVNRLLDIVQPHRLYMGQKDYQQFSIIRHMLEVLKSEVEIVMCPIVREADGLAMSSRNVRLTPEWRKKALVMYKTLQTIKEKIHVGPFAYMQQWAMQEIQSVGLQPEYIEIVDGRTLQPLSNAEESDHIVVCTAAWAGDVRLIDNILCT